MKLNPFNSPAYLIPAFALMSLPLARAAVLTWDGSVDNTWNNAANWDTNTTPLGGDTINIGAGNTVTHNHSQNLPGGGAIINLDGELNAGTLRWSGGTTNVGATGIISGGFRDLNNATFNFEDGAQFTASHWEQKNANVFNFNLSASGFTALTPGTLTAGAPPPTTTTYSADMASYTDGNNVVTLVDFGSDATGLTNATFTGGGQYSLSVNNPGADSGALYFDDVDKAVRLNVNQTKVWQGDAGAGFNTTGNWIGAADQSGPVSGVDNILLDTAIATASNQFMINDFTIADGRSFEAIGAGQHVVRLQSTLTIESGGTLDFTTDGNHILAESDDNTARMTIHSGADIDLRRVYSGNGWTFEFISGTDGVSTIGVNGGFWLRAGADLEVDVSGRGGGYFTETLFDYDSLFEASSFDQETISYGNYGDLTLSSFDPLGAATNLDFGTYWIDYTTGTDITLFYFVPEPSSTALLGLGGLALMLRRKRS
jgi:hypothetical protein